MKALHKFLENKIKPTFEEGGKLEKFYPAYDAIETFLFVPAHKTHNGVHIRDGIDLKRTMIMVVVALLPCLLFGMYNTGYQHYSVVDPTGLASKSFWDFFSFGLLKVLPIVVVSYAVGLGIEFGMAVIKKGQVEEGFLVSGMLIPLCLPADIPLWQVVIATAFAVIIGKEVFGGTGMNLLNPALTARAFLFFAYPKKMSGTDVWYADEPFSGTVDAVSGATQLGKYAELVKLKPDSPDAEAILNSAYSLQETFFGLIPGSIGETSVLACLIGAAILLITGIASWRIMLSMFAGGYLMALIFNWWGENMFMNVDPLEQLFLGGFMFGLVFMATDPVSAARTNKGKWIYGFLCGFLGIMIRVFNPAYPEGVMLAILFMNVMAPLIDHYVVQSNVKRRLKRLKLSKI